MSDAAASSQSSLPPDTYDALQRWADEDAKPKTPSLQIIRLDQGERFLLPFTSLMTQVDLHYLEYTEHRGFLRCNGKGCLMCRVGRPLETRHLWPVYDPLDETVGILPISNNIRPGALRPLVATVLKRLSTAEGPIQISVKKLDEYKFQLSTSPLAESAERGEAVIRSFLERFEAGAVDLASPYLQIDDETLAAFNTFQKLMLLKRIAL